MNFFSTYLKGVNLYEDNALAHAISSDTMNVYVLF